MDADDFVIKTELARFGRIKGPMLFVPLNDPFPRMSRMDWTIPILSLLLSLLATSNGEKPAEQQIGSANVNAIPAVPVPAPGIGPGNLPNKGPSGLIAGEKVVSGQGLLNAPLTGNVPTVVAQQKQIDPPPQSANAVLLPNQGQKSNVNEGEQGKTVGLKRKRKNKARKPLPFDPELVPIEGQKVAGNKKKVGKEGRRSSNKGRNNGARKGISREIADGNDGIEVKVKRTFPKKPISHSKLSQIEVEE